MFPRDHDSNKIIGFKKWRLTKISVFLNTKKIVALFAKMFPWDHNGKGLFSSKNGRLIEVSKGF